MQILRDRSHLAELCPPLDCRPRKHSLGLCVKNLTKSSLITKPLQVFPLFLYHARLARARARICRRNRVLPGPIAHAFMYEDAESER